MKKFLNIKILFIFGIFLFFLVINCKSSYAYTSEDYVLSGSYNRAWIESYLDLNQNPVDRNKKVNRFSSRLF